MMFFFWGGDPNMGRSWGGTQIWAGKFWGGTQIWAGQGGDPNMGRSGGDPNMVSTLPHPDLMIMNDE